MNWLYRALIGPIIWVLAFVCIYALHGAGCAYGWPSIATAMGSLHQLVLRGSFAFFLLAAAYALYAVPRGQGAAAQVIAAGGWIGLGGTAMTLFPVLGLTTCT